MNYDDFPILTNSDYELLKEKFFFPKKDRKAEIEKVCDQLRSLSSCNVTTIKLNAKVVNSLTSLKRLSSKLENTFSSLFSLHTSNNEILSISLFGFIKQFLECIRLLSCLAESEDKPYYRKIFISSSREILLEVSNIISSLEDSTIKFFKHM